MNEKSNTEHESIVTLGIRLVTLRERLGLTQDEIAQQLHIKKTIIDDIEHDRPTNVPMVFLRGYLKAYAELVKLPPDELRTYQIQLTSHYTSKPMRNYSRKEQNRRYGKRLLLLSIIILLIIIGTTLFFVWQDNKGSLFDTSRYVPDSSLSKPYDS